MKTKAKAYNWDTKIMSAIRKIWRFSPERRQCLAEATRDGLCLCHSCGQWVHHKLVTVDHVDPVVPTTGFDSWDGVIQRMRHNNLTTLCDPCHKLKTKAENAERAANRKAAKKARKS
jgi:5-methylcytosine-specific restriction endonuclease McrA